jgi:hypothetical protein
MTSRTCEQYDQQENEKADSQEDEVRRRKKIFQCEVGEEDAPEENGISNRLCSSTFIPPLTSFLQDPHGNWARDIARNAYTNGIKINAIQVPDEINALDSDAQSLMQDYRNTTCGWYSQIPISLMDATSVKEAILRMFYVAAACE